MTGNPENPVDVIGITGYSGSMLNFPDSRRPKISNDRLREYSFDRLRDRGAGVLPVTQDETQPLARRLKQARLKAVFGRQVGADPVLAALCHKGWAFRAKRRGPIENLSKPISIARRATPLGRPRIARRRTAGIFVRRAPFFVRDLSAPLAVIAPNLAAAAVIILLLFLIL